MFEFHTMFQYLIPSPVFIPITNVLFPFCLILAPSLLLWNTCLSFSPLSLTHSTLSLTHSFFSFRHCLVTLLLKKSHAFCLSSFQHLLLRVIISSYHSYCAPFCTASIISPGLGIILILWCFLFQYLADECHHSMSVVPSHSAYFLCISMYNKMP